MNDVLPPILFTSTIFVYVTPDSSSIILLTWLTTQLNTVYFSYVYSYTAFFCYVATSKVEISILLAALPYMLYGQKTRAFNLDTFLVWGSSNFLKRSVWIEYFKVIQMVQQSDCQADKELKRQLRDILLKIFKTVYFESNLIHLQRCLAKYNKINNKI